MNTKYVSLACGRITKVPTDYVPPAGYKLVSTGKGWEKEVRDESYTPPTANPFLVAYNAVPCNPAGNPYYPPQIADSTLLAHAEGAIAGWDAGCRTPTQRKDMERQRAALIPRGFTALAAEIENRLTEK